MRPQNFTAIRLVPDIRLRREFFGGLVYDTQNGNILEVNRGTFQFLRLIKDRALDLNDIIAFLVQNNVISNKNYFTEYIKKFDKSIDETLQKLLELKMVTTACFMESGRGMDLNQKKRKSLKAKFPLNLLKSHVWR